MNTPAQGPRAFLVGGGIAALAAAVYLLRDGHFPGASVRILEEESLGGSLDASGAAELGFSMRGSRMYGAAYELMYELLSHIPSLDDPGKSVTQDTLAFWVEAPWHDKARLDEQGRIGDAPAFGTANTGSVDPPGFIPRAAGGLDAQPDVAVNNYAWGTKARDGLGKYYFGREIAHYVTHQGAPWLERPERVNEEKPDLVLKALALKPGQIAADIGCGTGYFAWRFAEAVGTTGQG